MAGQVGRPDDPIAALQVREELTARPGVVAEREDVGAGGEQLLGELRRKPAAVGRVLGVDDAEVGAELVPERGEALLQRAAPRRPEDIGDEEDFQGRESVAAGRTSIETWLPASCV
jgi:hypothetical protein